jgi:hypothetical protein
VTDADSRKAEANYITINILPSPVSYRLTDEKMRVSTFGYVEDIHGK